MSAVIVDLGNARKVMQLATSCGIDYMAAMTDTAASGRAMSASRSIQIRGRVIRRERPTWAPLRTPPATLNQRHAGGRTEGDPPPA